MSALTVLGLDLSLTSTGIAVVRGEVEDEVPALIYSTAVKPGALRGVERWLCIVNGIEEGVFNAAAVTTLVAIEGYSFGARGNAVFQLGELGGIVRWELSDWDVPFVEIAPTTWRKQLFGRGNLPKDQVRLQAYRRFGVEIDSLDALEAYCVAVAAYRTARGLDKPAPKRSRKVA